ncbi:unnamed protein product, partial [Mesorhabditis belari]|uniref:ATP synthase peripheral stalk subunit OSCP, mitochondrial n=1 Tax=Mesorhabditis belari TaxID=2138241 RepID=A0AAF3FH05_9BILA
MASQVLKRSLSLSAVARSGQLVKVPIQTHGIEGRYASALYSAAHKQNKLEQVDKDLQTVKGIFEQNKKFKDFVLDPTLKAAKKKQVLQEITAALGTSQETRNFLTLLAENGRLSKLAAVVSSFESIMRAHRGELFVQVTTAEPLTKGNESALSDVLAQFTKKGQKVTVTYQVKPTILGGLIVNIGDKYVDLSIASKIKKYKEAIASAI